VPLGEHARDAQRVLVRFAATGGEERLGEIARGDLRHEPCELGPALLAEGRRDVAETLGLLLDRPDDLRVAVAQVDVDEARREIEDAPLARVQPRSLRAGDDERSESTLRRPGDEDVILGVPRDRGGV
jgi:hypothetical protein